MYLCCIFRSTTCWAIVVSTCRTIINSLCIELIQTAVPNECSNEKKHVHHDKSLMIQFENNPSFYKSECLKWIFNKKKTINFTSYGKSKNWFNVNAFLPHQKGAFFLKTAMHRHMHLVKKWVVPVMLLPYKISLPPR